MLGLGNQNTLTEQDWHALTSKVELPDAISQHLRLHGHDGAMMGCQRRYARLPVHKMAILIDGADQHACVSKDVSRVGMGFYSPVNFLPKKTMRLWLPSGQVVSLRVTRCRRQAEHCYEIGATYFSEADRSGHCLRKHD
jgi:hypothetical protein